MRIRAAALALAMCACSREQPPPAGGIGPAPVAQGATAAAPGAEGEVGYVTAAAPLRREPTDATRVPGPKPRATVPNFLALLQRGEKVSILETRGDWARVRASDGTSGWLKASALLPGQGVTEATLLAEADAFDRPDLLAVNARRKIAPGTLVLVIRSRELFSEVNVSSGTSAWVLTDRLSSSPRDVMAAKLVEKARWLERSAKPEEARAVLDLARREIPDSPLTEMLARELGEGADGGPAPAPEPAPR